MSQKITCPNCNIEIDLDKIANHKYEELILEQEKKLKKEQENQKIEFEKALEKEK